MRAEVVTHAGRATDCARLMNLRNDWGFRLEKFTRPEIIFRRLDLAVHEVTVIQGSMSVQLSRRYCVEIRTILWDFGSIHRHFEVDGTQRGNAGCCRQGG